MAPAVYDQTQAEIEGGEYLDMFSSLLRGWRSQGYRLCDLATLYAGLDPSHLPMHSIARGYVAGRAGKLAMQGPALLRPA